MDWEKYVIKEIQHFKGLENRIQMLQEELEEMDEDITCSHVAFDERGMYIINDPVFEQVWQREEKRKIHSRLIETLEGKKEMFDRVLQVLPVLQRKEIQSMTYSKSSLRSFYEAMENEKDKRDQEKAEAEHQEKLQKVKEFTA